MPTELLVCDIAGTTIVDKDFVSIAFIDAFMQEGIDLHIEEVKPIMGFKKTEAIEMVLKERNVQYNDIQIQRINAHFEAVMIQFYATSPEVEPLPGVLDLFEYCIENDIVVALNSGFPRKIVDVILDRLGWIENGWVSLVITSDEVEQGRPAPFMIHQLMQWSSVEDPSLVIKVGDTMVDIEEGRNARCGKVVAVTTGSYTREQLELYGPDAIIDNLNELRELL